MKAYRILSAIALTATLSLGLVATADAACTSNSQPFGATQITGYNADGSRNITVWMSDPDASNVGGIARYNTQGQVLQVTNVPYMNFTIKGSGQYVIFKNVGVGGCFVNWVKGFNY